jgi:hypothetical protein
LPKLEGHGQGQGEEIGRLMVHSPVCYDDKLGEAIEKLGGKVGVLVAPNYEHVKYIKQWSEVYPEAEVWACPGLSVRMPDVRWTNEFTQDTRTNKPSKDGLEVLWLDCEVNPFTGKPFFNEVIFFHRQSKSLIITDAFWNYPETDRPNYDGITGTGLVHNCPKVTLPTSFSSFSSSSSPFSSLSLPSVPMPTGSSAWKFGMDKVYLPFYKSLMVGKTGPRRQRLESIVNTVLLKEWDIENIVPCHGDVIRGPELCQRVLREHFLG